MLSKTPSSFNFQLSPSLTWRKGNRLQAWTNMDYVAPAVPISIVVQEVGQLKGYRGTYPIH